MGVKELWPLLEPARTLKTFEDMQGETVAIDLSMWIAESQSVKQMTGVVKKPHLRNLFFRTSALLHADITPVIVIEGRAPEVKWQTMADRLKTRTGKDAHSKANYRQASRSHFKSVLKECCEMLEYLGVSYVQAEGEAEAMCAALNRHGLVDAVITEDGDAFLYGAHTIYKNFSTSKMVVDSYSMTDIEDKVHLYQNHLIAFGLLVGCDYCRSGVSGVGKTQALNLCLRIPHHSILDRLLQWSDQGLCGDETSDEKPVAVKVIKMGANGFKQVINEFKKNRQCARLPAVEKWRKPLIAKAQEFNLTKLEWPVNYSLEKMLPLLTLWSLKHVTQHQLRSDQLSIVPERLLKRRVRRGMACLEVLWSVSDPYTIDNDDDRQPVLSTIQQLDIMEKCFPIQVQQFLDSKSGKGSKGKSKNPSKNPISSPQRTSREEYNGLPPKLSSDSSNQSHPLEVELSLTPLVVGRGGDDSSVCLVDDNSNSKRSSLADESSLPQYELLTHNPQTGSSWEPARREEIHSTPSGATTPNLSSHHIDVNELSHLSIAAHSSPSLQLPDRGKRNQQIPRADNSLDILLNDISDQLRESHITSSTTPNTAAAIPVNMDPDSILTGHLTPEGSSNSGNCGAQLLSAGERHRLNLTRDNCNSPSDWPAESADSLSELSLFSVDSNKYSTISFNQSQPDIRTPPRIDSATSYGNFDIVSRLSTDG